MSTSEVRGWDISCFYSTIHVKAELTDAICCDRLRANHTHTHWGFMSPTRLQVWFDFGVCVMLLFLPVLLQMLPVSSLRQTAPPGWCRISLHSHSEQHRWHRRAPGLPAAFKQPTPQHKMFLHCMVEVKELRRCSNTHPQPLCRFVSSSLDLCLGGFLLNLDTCSN